MKKKNIVILVNSMGSGGAERVVSLLNEEFLKDNYIIHLLVLEKSLYFPIHKDVKYVELSKSKSKFNRFLITFIRGPFKLKKYCQVNKIDIVISHLYRSNYTNSLSKIIGNKTKSIGVQHSHASNSYSTPKFKNSLSKFLIKQLITKLDNTLTVSELMRLDLIENFNFSKEKVFNVGNPINFNKIQSDINDEVYDTSIFGKFTFISLGSFIKRKNHELIIRAAFLIKDLDFKLILMGQGGLKSFYINLIKELNLENKVEIIDFDPNPFKFLSISDCLINSSNSEGLPMAILEALACNLPVISSDCLSGPREILAPDSDFEIQISQKIEYCEFGILFPINNVDLLAEAMRNIIIDKNLQTSYRSKALIRSEYFKSENIYKLYKNVFDE